MDRISGKEFDLFAEGCRVTDDSLMTAAVAEAFLTMRETDLPETESVLGPLLCERMRRLGRTYPDAGYGQKFKAWLMDETMGPYGSCGNGAAMRVLRLAGLPTPWRKPRNWLLFPAV